MMLPSGLGVGEYVHILTALKQFDFLIGSFNLDSNNRTIEQNIFSTVNNYLQYSTVQFVQPFALGPSSSAIPISSPSGLENEQKQLYQWSFKDISKVNVRTVVEGTLVQGRYCYIRPSDLKQMVVRPPDMSLRATAEYFVGRLSPDDKHALSETMRGLHGKCIRIGSTCSGTDVIIPVMHHTFEALSQLFNVSWLKHSEYCILQYLFLFWYTKSLMQLEYGVGFHPV